ncbi:Hpt domain-containing protein [Colwelliaceae bacterium MEBiC 14330]
MEETNNMSDIDGIKYAIGINNVLGDQALFKEILVMFYQEHNQDGQKIKRAIQVKDMAKAKSIAHTLKGVASSVGAMDLYEVTRALDIAIGDNQADKLAALLVNLLLEFDKVMQGISLKLNVN